MSDTQYFVIKKETCLECAGSGDDKRFPNSGYICQYCMGSGVKTTHVPFCDAFADFENRLSMLEHDKEMAETIAIWSPSDDGN